MGAMSATLEEDWKEQNQLPLNFGKIINMAKGEW